MKVFKGASKLVQMIVHTGETIGRASKLVQMIVHTGESIQRGFKTGANDSAPIGEYALQQAARRRPIGSMLRAMFTVNLCTLEC